MLQPLVARVERISAILQIDDVAERFGQRMDRAALHLGVARMITGRIGDEGRTTAPAADRTAEHPALCPSVRRPGRTSPVLGSPIGHVLPQLVEVINGCRCTLDG